MRATVRGVNGDLNPFNIFIGSSPMRFCPKETLKSFEKPLSYQILPEIHERGPVLRWGIKIKVKKVNLAKVVKNVVKTISSGANTLTKGAQNLATNVAELVSKVVDLSIIPCFTMAYLPDPRKIHIQSPFDSGWNNSDTLAYLGGKYYDYPKGKATRYLLCDLHHEEFDPMFATVWRYMDRAGLVKDVYQQLKLDSAGTVIKDANDSLIYDTYTLSDVIRNSSDCGDTLKY